MSAPLWTAAEAAAACAVQPTSAWAATGVSIDTRTLAPGDLFVALHGPKHDGHAYVADALARGAAAAVVDRPPPNVAPDAPLLHVADTMIALSDLGRAARNHIGGRVIGVTGSVGKTGTKEALRHVLAEQGTTCANAGSLNNHWGLPLSLARMPAGTRFGVFEMGMNHAGEIAPLSQLARPNVAVVTTVEAVHIAHFPSVAAIADAKAEIFAGLVAGGVAVLNRDNSWFDRLADAARAAGAARILAFGRAAESDVRLLDADCGADGSRVHASVEGSDVRYRLKVPGAHWVANSLCVLATVVAAGADVSRAATALAGFAPPDGRGRRHPVAVVGGDVDVIDDSYNASPVSMSAAFDVLGRAQPAAGGRRVAALGDMLELGDEGPELHAALAAELARNRVDRVYTAGPLMAHLFEAVPAAMRGGHAADSEVLAPMVAAAVRAGDVVLVKGSAGSRMGRIVSALRGLADLDRRQQAVNGE